MRNQRNRQHTSRNSRNGANARPTEVLAVLAALVFIAALGVGIFMISARKSEAKPIDLLVGVDTTSSMSKQGRQQCFGVFDETVDTVIPQETQIKFWSFDVNAHKIADKSSGKSRDLWDLEDQIIATHTNQFGTYPVNVLDKMLVSAQEAQAHGKGCACMLLTDGEDQDMKNTDKAMEKLAAMPNLKAVWIHGASTDNGFRSNLEKRFKPMLGDRLIISSNHDAEDGLNRFRDLLDKK